LKGYLSLHYSAEGALSIKWTPNELMNGGLSEPTIGVRCATMHPHSCAQPSRRSKSNWELSLNIVVSEIIYLHYHATVGDGGSIVLVGADGVQHPPILFPKGQHPIQFLTCLEQVRRAGVEPAFRET